ncbi:MAG: M48 family metallopeptidase [Bdellovibrionales bacterium]
MLKAWLSPKWRIWIFLIFINAVWMTATWLWVERENWLWITPIALSINFLLLTYDQVLHFRALNGQPLVGNDPWGLLKIVHELSDELKIPTPNTYLLLSPSAQIFAYAKTRKHTRLFVSEGALGLLNPRQLRAVLTFQMLAIRGQFNLLNYWMAAVLDLFFRVGRTIEKAFAFVFGWAPPLAAWFISPWMWILRAALLTSRDFERLDFETARLLDSPEDLAQALWKMEAYAQTKPWPEPWIFAHMCMVSPLSFKRSTGFMRVQPPLQGRIKTLVGRYPL